MQPISLSTKQRPAAFCISSTTFLINSASRNRIEYFLIYRMTFKYNMQVGSNPSPDSDGIPCMSPNIQTNILNLVFHSFALSQDIIHYSDCNLILFLPKLKVEGWLCGSRTRRINSSFRFPFHFHCLSYFEKNFKFENVIWEAEEQCDGWKKKSKMLSRRVISSRLK